jgi:ATP-dependent Lon protease
MRSTSWGQDFRGDPASALLEVLDPEQNHTFSDHYVEVDFDLSDVMFVATSNSMNIPPALLDRMEVIRLSGYTEDEKTNIAMRYLLPKQMKNNGVREDELLVEESAVRDIVRYYTREAGVRSLERELSKICRKVIKGLQLKKMTPLVKVNADNLNDFLGRAQVHLRPCRGAEPGGPGGRPGVDRSRRRPADDRGRADARQGRHPAHGFARRRDEGIGGGRPHRGAQPLACPGHQGRTVREEGHPHPRARWRHAQGRPERGPAMTTALVSALTGIPVRADVAMTGEITLRGEVTAIGGLKEKLLAALRGGIKTVLIIPEENTKDLQDIPENVKNDLEIVPVKWIDKVLEIALERHPTALTDDEPQAVAARRWRQRPSPCNIERWTFRAPSGALKNFDILTASTRE